MEAIANALMTVDVYTPELEGFKAFWAQFPALIKSLSVLQADIGTGCARSGWH